MRVLSLFSGGGLGDYGLTLAGMEIAGQVEIDEYCQKILSLRWPEVPKWRDIREVKGEEVLRKCGRIDLVSGGFPCQPFSVAGKQRGKEDDRHLWPEMLRIITEVKPAWVLGENVSGLIRLGLDEVLSDLEGQGYACQTFVIPACAVDAPHRRDRVWIVGYSEHFRRITSKERGSIESRNDSGKTGQEQASKFERSSEQYGALGYSDSLRMEGTRTEQQAAGISRTSENMADSECKGLEGHGQHKNYCTTKKPSKKSDEESLRKFNRACELWQAEPELGRVAHGVANRVDRLKCLGNGQVPQVVAAIGKRIMEFNQRGGRG